MSTPQPPPPLPRAALRLGFLALAPMAISALVSLYAGHSGTAHFGIVAFAVYCAALLSFLGGIRCGMEILRAPHGPNPLRLVFSALPALAGWALTLFVLLIPGAIGAAAGFAGLFAAQYVWDQHSARDAGAPEWYPALRQVLTGGTMIICLLIPLAAAIRGF
ncbi:MAG: DUF3429 domain-containing protein [Terricaulis sp.]